MTTQNNYARAPYDEGPFCMEPENIAAVRKRFSGFADTYAAYRPPPPEALAEILCLFARVTRPALVVDLGCGTGLSTRYWSGRAAQVIGIDPTGDMLAQARRQPATPQLSYLAGFSHRTALPAGCADLVTCSQALHWMEPHSTFAEAARILRRGGVFAAYDYDFPPIVGCWEVNAAYAEMDARVHQLERECQLSRDLLFWTKADHLAQMRASGCFRHVTEVSLHQRDSGSAQRLIGLALSQGNVQTLLKHGLAESEFGLDRLRAVARELLEDAPQPWYWSYCVRIGVV